MAESTPRSSPLGEMADELRAASSDGVTLRELPFLTQVNVRGAAEDGGFGKAIEAVAGIPLPLTPNTVTTGRNNRALWLGPDEWLIVAPDGRSADLSVRLEAALAGRHVSVVDVGASRTVLELGGSRAREVLEKGCTLDLHPRAFASGRCAGTIMAKIQLILEQTDDTPVYRLYVRSSYAGHMAEWLIDAMAEFRK